MAILISRTLSWRDKPYLLGSFVRCGFRALWIRRIQAGLALIAVRYSGPPHVVLERFEGKLAGLDQVLYLVQQCGGIEVCPLDALVALHTAVQSKEIPE